MIGVDPGAHSGCQTGSFCSPFHLLPKLPQPNLSRNPICPYPKL